MRLDATDLRYLTPDEFRILTAVEMGSKNHELVPTSLIAEISGIRGGNVNKCLGGLAKRNLVARVQNAKYDGYRLTYGGLDYLALRTFSRRKPASVSSVGKKIGVGKESDIYLVKDDVQDSRVLKMHRLGRISFRAIKSKRDYLGKRKSATWMYMSRLAAQKEFAFMKALYQHGFPVPVPIDQARHCIVMTLIDSYPLRSIEHVPDVGELYAKLMTLIVDLALAGLIHGDFNEFNILIRRKSYEPVVIDFPQMVSVRHENAEYFFARDVNCIRRFFRRRFHFEGQSWPLWKDVLAELKANEESSNEGLASVAEEEREEEEEEIVAPAESSSGPETAKEGDDAEDSAGEEGESKPKRVRIDLEVEASGFGRALQEELEQYMEDIEDIPDSDPEEDDEEDEEDEEEVAEDENAAAVTKLDDNAGPSDPFDEEAFQAQMSARLEAIRLNKALGNDDPDDANSSDESDEEEYDSDSSTDVSDGPPQSDFTTYTRSNRGRASSRGGRGAPSSSAGSGSGRPKARKDDMRVMVAKRIEKELGGGAGKGPGGGSAPAKGKAGKAKGHKWKANPRYLVGNTNDGW